MQLSFFHNLFHLSYFFFFFFNDTATTEIYTLSLHDALPISLRHWNVGKGQKVGIVGLGGLGHMGVKFAKAKSVDLGGRRIIRSEEHTSELQSLTNIVCRLLLEKKNTKKEYRSGTDQ